MPTSELRQLCSRDGRLSPPHAVSKLTAAVAVTGEGTAGVAYALGPGITMIVVDGAVGCAVGGAVGGRIVTCKCIDTQRHAYIMRSTEALKRGPCPAAGGCSQLQADECLTSFCAGFPDGCTVLLVSGFFVGFLTGFFLVGFL